MKNGLGLIRDYKANVPLHMLSSKYELPIHEIIRILYALATKDKNNDTR